MNVATFDVLRCSRDGVAGKTDENMIGEMLEVVRLFKYLGSYVTANGVVVAEEKIYRVKYMSKIFGIVKGMLRNIMFCMKATIGVHEGVIMPS